MAESSQDIWSQWLLERRFGGDKAAMEKALESYLYPWRDRILGHADLQEGETLLDVGCGDGLVAFGALDKTRTGRVIFSDISEPLLDHCRALVSQMGLTERCRFLSAPAEDLSSLEDESVDVVTTRSVLIYVSAKQRAFDEFYRVLRPGGRLSIFEPINRFREPEPAHMFGGFDVTPVAAMAGKIRALYEQLQPAGLDPMVDFDERDLLVFAESAGFSEIHLDLQVEIGPEKDGPSWEVLYHTAPNPKVPTLEEAMAQALTPQEAEAFIAHLRPLVEGGQRIRRGAVAFLWAIK